jgi:uncharacterized protein, YfiH family
MLQFDQLGSDCNIFHFITTCNAEIEDIDVSHIVIPSQTHEDEILTIDDDFLFLSEDKQAELLDGVDALITALPDVCVGVKTADCVPILLYAPDKKVVAAIHAGWRGTVLQVVAKVVAYMTSHYGVQPSSILAGIAPSISQDAFEVGEEVAEALAESSDQYLDLSEIIAYNHNTSKAHINLWEANRQQLIKAGLESANIEVAGICTYSNTNIFYSARRSGIGTGRMISGIMIKPSI